MKYPLAAQLKQTQGVVVVRAELDEQGNVVSSTAISGAEKLVPDSVQNIKQWRFRPTPQKAAIVVYDFRIEGWCNNVTSHFVFRDPNIVSIRGCGLSFQP